MTSTINIFVVPSILLIFLIVVKAGSIYDLTVEDHEGTEVPLKKFHGKVTLIVNVASHCGYTEGTYRSITRLHDILSFGNHFSVLAFPCNQFGEQEPDDVSEVVTAMQANYGVEFPIFNKINVVGREAIPLFRALIDQSGVVPDWNFYKYLVDWKGEVLNAWGTSTTIEEIFDEIEAAVEEAKKASDDASDTLPVKEELEQDDQDQLHSNEESKDEL